MKVFINILEFSVKVYLNNRNSISTVQNIIDKDELFIIIASSFIVSKIISKRCVKIKKVS